jgi:hypothetical protein
LKRFASSNTDRRTATRYAVRHNLLASKHVSKVSWRLMIKIMPER